MFHFHMSKLSEQQLCICVTVRLFLSLQFFYLKVTDVRTVKNMFWLPLSWGVDSVVGALLKFRRALKLFRFFKFCRFILVNVLIYY